MSTRVADRVEEWDAQPFDGGYRGLQGLADREFSGVVRAGGVELYMTRGVAVGVSGGDIEAFEDATGTVYEAPSPALPVLAVMQERSDEVRDKFYSEKTPIAEVDSTLADGGFTGYIELSENVLSGDYYLVYHGGESMSVGFVGEAERLIHGEEAFETADDEVGIYEVRPASVDHIDLPEPTTPRDTTATEVGAGPRDAETEPATEHESASEPADDQTDTVDTDVDEPTERAPAESRDATTAQAGESEDPEPAGDTAESSAEGEMTGETESGEGESGVGGADLERQAIPSLDPTQTQRAEQSERDQSRDQAFGPEGSTVDGASGERSVATLEAKLDERDAEIEQLEEQLAVATGEREDLRDQLASVREERDALAREVEQLTDQLQRLESELGAAPNPDQQRSAEEALTATDIFVRYHSKGKATLETAHDGAADRDEVVGNLQLETHTQFDSETTAVEGQSYAAFLEGTIEFRFVRWVVSELLFEIRETGHETALSDLYDALPALDRAELGGAVEYDDETRESFDVVFRDRMGEPLLVANLNAAREGATEAMTEDVITAAERVGQSAESFAGAFLVTQSFFEPGALEIASEASQGGLLSRDKRKSFVKLSRKRGYHLCLVEARAENFHLTVPEL